MVNKPPVLGQILEKIAPKIGARVILEPEWNYVGQIIYKSGRIRYFRYSSLDLNPLGASEIAKDKGYADFFIQNLGYPTIPGRTFYSPAWRKSIKASNASALLEELTNTFGFPLIVKPNNGSQGRMVQKVFNNYQLHQALKLVFTEYKVAIVQQYISGKDYRLVVLDNKVISAYERIPFNIIGDGRSNIKELITKKLAALKVADRPATLKIDDPRIGNVLKRNKLRMSDRLVEGQKVFLLDNANLSTGGDSIDVTHTLHNGFKELAINLTKDMGLRLCGVDLIIQSSITSKPEKYFITEINAAPGLDHYIKMGEEQVAIVEDLYTQVLLAMDQ